MDAEVLAFLIHLLRFEAPDRASLTLVCLLICLCLHTGCRHRYQERLLELQCLPSLTSRQQTLPKEKNGLYMEEMVLITDAL